MTPDSYTKFQLITSNDDTKLWHQNMTSDHHAYKINIGHPIMTSNHDITLTSIMTSDNIIEKIISNSKLSLKKSTPKDSQKFNLFFIDLK